MTTRNPGSSLPQKPLLTVEAAALLLSVSTRTVRRAIADGSLAIIRIGRSVRITETALSSFMTGAAR